MKFNSSDHLFSSNSTYSLISFPLGKLSRFFTNDFQYVSLHKKGYAKISPDVTQMQ